MEILKVISLVVYIITNGVYVCESIWKLVNQVRTLLEKHKNNRLDPGK